MKFFTLEGHHINVEQISYFCHCLDTLVIHFGSNRVAIPDSFKNKYHRLCELTGVAPDNEEVSE